MSKRKDGQARGQYALEYKLEAVRLVKGGQAVPVTANILGVPLAATVVGLKDSYHRSYEPREPCRAVLPQPRGSALPSGETLP